MDTQAFLSGLSLLWDGDPQVADHPRDRRFRAVLDTVRGMATENKLALLNFAASNLEPGEIYLEVGAFAGCSIIAAALGNDAQFVTIDDYSRPGSSAEECRRNLARYGLDNVELIDADVWDVLSDPPFSAPVGVYFYDGGHRFVEQYRALEAIEPLLADDALVIIDDTRRREVARANRLYTSNRPQFEPVLRFVSPSADEPRWWNGLEVYAFRRARGPGRPPSTVMLTLARAAARVNTASIRHRAARLLREAARDGRRVVGRVTRRFRSRATHVDG